MMKVTRTYLSIASIEDPTGGGGNATLALGDAIQGRGREGKSHHFGGVLGPQVFAVSFPSLGCFIKYFDGSVVVLLEVIPPKA